MSDILTTNECAERLRVTGRTLRQMVTDGKIPSFRIGGERGHLRFDWDEVLATLRDQGREEREASVGE